MSKEEKKRTFESETLILPALKMVLVDNEQEQGRQPTKKAKTRISKDFNEETVRRIIGKLSAKDS